VGQRIALAEIRLDVLEVGVIVEQVIALSEHGFGV
jgi:hypothetical protein